MHFIAAYNSMVSVLINIFYALILFVLYKSVGCAETYAGEIPSTSFLLNLAIYISH